MGKMIKRVLYQRSIALNNSLLRALLCPRAIKSPLAFNAEFPLNGGTFPPFGVITNTDHGSYVVIVTWILGSISILFVAIRAALVTHRTRRFGLDNAPIIGGLVFCIGQSIAATLCVSYGLGRHLDTLSTDDIHSYYKAALAVSILSAVVFVLSKLSILVLIASITPSEITTAAVNYSSGFILLWGIANILSVSLRCAPHIPAMFEQQSCVDEKALFYSHDVINITTEVILLILPLTIVWGLQIRPQKKAVVLGLFWTRILVPVAIGFHLDALSRYLFKGDPTWNYLLPSLWNQVVVHTSIMTACIPAMKPFLDSLQSSLLDSGVPRHYVSSTSVELRLWNFSRKNERKTDWEGQDSLRGIGLSTTRTVIEGGVRDDSSTRALTSNGIYQQLDVEVRTDRAV
ncbi:hypothetical protein F5Y18DRAFT_277060 [Xylariaceae sp. FL1019]|nr:hypothetical protein F5Y18DRAFT_277060 [Xylariaceae sp. FL1019]